MKLKRVFSLLVVMVLAFVLAACGKEVNLLDVVDEAIEGIEYQDGDKKTSVTVDIILPETSKLAKDAKIVWESENEDIISSEGIVTRPTDKNTPVKLIVTVSLDGKKEEGSTRLTVKKAEGNNNVGGGNNVDISDGLIGSVEEFMAITDFSKKYKLENDIDFDGKEIKPLGYWNDGGDRKKVFTGEFDGQGFALKNFKLTGSKHEDELVDGNGDSFGTALFPRLKGTVKNLAVVDAVITGSGFIGGIAGIIDGGKVENVFFKGKIVATKGWEWNLPGGSIAGMLGANATVKDVLVFPTEINGAHLVAGFSFSPNTSGIYVINTIVDTDASAPLLFDGPSKTDNGSEEISPENLVKATKVSDFPQTIFDHFKKYNN